MAALVEPKGGLDLKKFSLAVKRELPSYAIPLFVRVVEKLDITGMKLLTYFSCVEDEHLKQTFCFCRYVQIEKTCSPT